MVSTGLPQSLVVIADRSESPLHSSSGDSRLMESSEDLLRPVETSGD